jgi:hypothetical protein
MAKAIDVDTVAKLCDAAMATYYDKLDKGIVRDKFALLLKTLDNEGCNKGHAMRGFLSCIENLIESAYRAGNIKHLINLARIHQVFKNRFSSVNYHNHKSGEKPESMRFIRENVFSDGRIYDEFDTDKDYIKRYHNLWMQNELRASIIEDEQPIRPKRIREEVIVKEESVEVIDGIDTKKVISAIETLAQVSKKRNVYKEILNEAPRDIICLFVHARESVASDDWKTWVHCIVDA